MKFLKRTIICLAMAVTCLFAAFSFTACGNGPTEGLKYTVIESNGVPVSYKVTGIGTATDTKIIIPSSYQDLPVTEVGAYAFYMADKITSVSIPESVTSIADYSFAGCTSLKNVNIPEGVIYIGNAAFLDCASLTSITVPGKVMIIGSMAFARCTLLNNVVLSEGVKYIGMQMFMGCTSLANVTVAQSVTSYGSQCFAQCSALKSFSISENVKNIGFKAFEGCTSLGSANFATASGWKASDILSSETEDISEESLSDASTAAVYLANTYSAYAWKRS